MANLINYDSFKKKAEQYHTNYVIDEEQTLDQVLQKLSSDPNIIYRGLNNASFRLYTSAQRHYIWKDDLYKFIGYSLESSLFFAQDGYTPAIGDGSLNDYISLYFTSNQIDWIQATIQSINKKGAEKADRMIEETEKDPRYTVDTSDVIFKMQKLHTKTTLMVFISYP